MTVTDHTLASVVRTLDPRSRIVAGVIARAADRGHGSAELSRIEIAEAAGMTTNAGSLARVSAIAAELVELGLITADTRAPNPTAYTAVSGLKEATRDALAIRGLSPGESWVLCNLEDHAGDTPETLPSPNELADKLGISRRTFDRTVAALEAGGWLVVDRGEHGRVIRYQVRER